MPYIMSARARKGGKVSICSCGTFGKKSQEGNLQNIKGKNKE
jgi:hypothetical protein